MAGSIPTLNFSGSQNYIDPFANLMKGVGPAGIFAQKLNAMDKQEELDRQQGNDDRLFKIQQAEEDRKLFNFNEEQRGREILKGASNYRNMPTAEASVGNALFEQEANKVGMGADQLVSTLDPSTGNMINIPVGASIGSDGTVNYTEDQNRLFDKQAQIGDEAYTPQGLQYKIENAMRNPDAAGNKYLLDQAKGIAAIDKIYGAGGKTGSMTDAQGKIFDVQKSDIQRKYADEHAENLRQNKIYNKNQQAATKGTSGGGSGVKSFGESAYGISGGKNNQENRQNIKGRDFWATNTVFGTQEDSLQLYDAMIAGGMDDQNIKAVFSQNPKLAAALIGASRSEKGSTQHTKFLSDVRTQMAADKTKYQSSVGGISKEEFDAREAELLATRDTNNKALLGSINGTNTATHETFPQTANRIFGNTPAVGGSDADAEDPVTPGSSDGTGDSVVEAAENEATGAPENNVSSPNRPDPRPDAPVLGTQADSVSNDGFIIDNNGVKSQLRVHPGDTEATIIRKKRNIEIDKELNAIQEQPTTYKSKQAASKLEDEKQFNSEKNALQYKMNPTGDNNIISDRGWRDTLFGATAGTVDFRKDPVVDPGYVPSATEGSVTDTVAPPVAGTGLTPGSTQPVGSGQGPLLSAEGYAPQGGGNQLFPGVGGGNAPIMTDSSLLGPQTAVDPGTTAVLGHTRAPETPEQLGARGDFPVLAQKAGADPVAFNSIMKKLVDIESSGGNYEAVNKDTKAYGKYQFLPSTLKEYAKKTNQTIAEAKTPMGQEKMFQKYTADSIDFLNLREIPITALNLYGAHQQGRGGISQILQSNSKPRYLIDDKVAAGIRQNVPGTKNMSKKELAVAWVERWAPEFA